MADYPAHEPCDTSATQNGIAGKARRPATLSVRIALGVGIDIRNVEGKGDSNNEKPLRAEEKAEEGEEGEEDPNDGSHIEDGPEDAGVNRIVLAGRLQEGWARSQ